MITIYTRSISRQHLYFVMTVGAFKLFRQKNLPFIQIVINADLCIYGNSQLMKMLFMGAHGRSLSIF